MAKSISRVEEIGDFQKGKSMRIVSKNNEASQI